MKTIQHQQEGTVRSNKLIRRFSCLFIAWLLFVQILSFSFITQTFSAERDIHIGVDYRIELLTIMQYLGGVNLTKPLNCGYVDEVIQYFAPYKDQDSIKSVRTFVTSVKSIDTPVGAILHFSQPPEFMQIAPIPSDLLDRCRGQERLDTFMKALRTFASTTKFTTFMNSQQAFFKKMKDETKLESVLPPYLEQLESYYGMKQHSYNIILAPFIHCGGFGPSVILEDGSRDIYSVIGPCSVINNIPTFLYDKKGIEDIIFHEFSHSFVNPLTDQNSKKVNECKKLFRPISSEMADMQYGEWEICLNEHLIRTFTTRMLAFNHGDNVSKDQEEVEIKMGFVYLPLLLEQYKTYENNRSTYKTYKEFYLYLLGYLKELSTFPSIPTGFKISLVGGGTIGLEWKDNANDEKGYKVYRAINSPDSFTLIAELPKNTESFDDKELETGKMYWYKVSAYNDNGEICTPTLTLPEEPSFPYASSVNP